MRERDGLFGRAAKGYMEYGSNNVSRRTLGNQNRCTYWKPSVQLWEDLAQWALLSFP